MNNDFEQTVDIFLGTCQDPDHQFVIQTYDWGRMGDEPAETCVDFYLSIHLTDWPGWWKRFVNSIRYVFGKKSKFGHFDPVQLTYSDVDKLINLLKDYKKKVDKYRKSDKIDKNTVFRVGLNQIPSYYGIKFLYADVQPPLGGIYFSVNGEVQPVCLRVDVEKQIFLDRHEQNAVMQAIDFNSKAIFDIISAAIKSA